MKGKRLLEFRMPRTGELLSFRTKSYYIYPDGRVWNHEKRRFVAQYENPNGYIVVDLFDDEGARHSNIGVHRLIASVFKRLIERGEEVHHVDHCKTNNSLENLEIIPASVHARRHTIEKWKNGTYDGHCDMMKNAWASGRFNGKFEKFKNVGISRPAKYVAQLDMYGQLIHVWPSTKECQRNGYIQAQVSNCCLGKRKTHKGYRWQYLEDYLAQLPTPKEQWEARQLFFDFSE